MSPAKNFYRDLLRYARWRTEQLSHCHCEIEKKINDGKYDLLDKNRQQLESGAAEDPSLGRLLYHLEYTLGNTLRYTLIIGVCSVLEESVKAIAEEEFPDKGKRNATLMDKSQTGKNWLQKHIHLFATLPGFTTSELFQLDVARFSDIITLRNCIGHSWGNVAKDAHPDQVTKAVRRIRIREEQEKCHFAAISPDGYLVLGDNMVSDSINLAEIITEDLCACMSHPVSD
jgi:hypothetical protein